MPNNEAVKHTLELFRDKEKQLLGQLRSVRLTITNLELELGIESAPSPEVEISLVSPGLPEASQTSFVGKKLDIRADEFFGMTHAEAAKAYLKKVGHAASFEELVEALQKGGCKVGGANPKRVLYISLIRNTRDFVPPQKGYIGLREFYPTGARIAKNNVQKAPKRRARKPKALRSDRSQTEKVEIKTDAQPSQLAEAVRAVLSDKQPHSIEEIVQTASAKLGQSVKKIGVFGVLRNKSRFEKVDGQYRLL